MTEIPLENVRSQLSALFGRVADLGEEFAVTVAGERSAMIVPVHRWESLRETMEILENEKFVQDLDRAALETERIPSSKALDPPEPPAEEVWVEIPANVSTGINVPLSEMAASPLTSGSAVPIPPPLEFVGDLKDLAEEVAAGHGLTTASSAADVREAVNARRYMNDLQRMHERTSKLTAEWMAAYGEETPTGFFLQQMVQACMAAMRELKRPDTVAVRQPPPQPSPPPSGIQPPHTGPVQDTLARDAHRAAAAAFLSGERDARIPQPRDFLGNSNDPSLPDLVRQIAASMTYSQQRRKWDDLTIPEMQTCVDIAIATVRIGNAKMGTAGWRRKWGELPPSIQTDAIHEALLNWSDGTLYAGETTKSPDPNPHYSGEVAKRPGSALAIPSPAEPQHRRGTQKAGGFVRALASHARAAITSGDRSDE